MIRSWRALRNSVCALVLAPALGGSSPRAFAQERRAGDNPIARALYGSHTSPQIRQLETRREDALESMARDGKIRLTEADVVRLALENNVDINVERYTPYFTLWEVTKGRGVLNPTIEFKSEVNRLVTPSASVLQGGDTLLTLNTLYDLTVRKPFVQGLDVDLHLTTRRLRSSSFFFSLNPSLTPDLSVTVTQHLLKDFGRISRGRFVRIARNDYGMSEEDFVTRVSETLATALNTYWEIVFIDEDIKVKQSAHDLAKVVLDQNKIQVEVGTMSPLDVVQAEAELATRAEQLVVARYNKRNTEDQLKKLLSSRLDPGLVTAEIEPVSKPSPADLPTSDVTQAIQRALEVRPEVKRQRLDQENKKIEVDYTRNQLRPTLDVVATYSQNGLGGTRIVRDYTLGFVDAPIVRVEPGGFGDALDSLFSRRFLGYVVGFNFKMAVGNDDARARNAQAQIEYRQGDEKMRALRQKIALEVRDAYDRLERDRARVAAAEVTVHYGERKLQGEQDKYNLGATTTRFILEAQRDLQDAASRLARARVDLVKSRIAVDKAVGDVFSTYGIEVKQALGFFK